MNPTTISDPRPLVWTISMDDEAKKIGRAYCIYTNGQLLRENMTVEEFLDLYNSIKRA